jgi:hypothetical protein
MQERSINIKKAKATLDLYEWLKWLILGTVVIIGIFPLIAYIKRQISKGKEVKTLAQKKAIFEANKNPIHQEKIANSITHRPDIKAAALSLATDLGTAYSDAPDWKLFSPSTWFALDPRGMTENDTAAANTLIKQRKNIEVLGALYFNCYTNGRNLKMDVLKLLDEDQLTRVRKYLKI